MTSTETTDTGQKLIKRSRVKSSLQKPERKYQQLLPAVELLVNDLRRETINEMNRKEKLLKKRRRLFNFGRILGGAIGTLSLVTILLLSWSGIIIWVIGSAIAILATWIEKVLEVVVLERVQWVVDRDKKQYMRVCKIWKGFEESSHGVIGTVNLPIPAKECDITSWKTWYMVTTDLPFSKKLMYTTSHTAPMFGRLFIFFEIPEEYHWLIRHFVVFFGLLSLFPLISSVTDLLHGSQSYYASILCDKKKSLQNELNIWLKHYG